MKTFLLIITCCILSGCATPVKLLASYYNSQDPCQLQNIPGNSLDQKTANMPSYCGNSAGRVYIYTNSGGRTGYISR